MKLIPSSRYSPDMAGDRASMGTRPSTFWRITFPFCLIGSRLRDRLQWALRRSIGLAWRLLRLGIPYRRGRNSRQPACSHGPQLSPNAGRSLARRAFLYWHRYGSLPTFNRAIRWVCVRLNAEKLALISTLAANHPAQHDPNASAFSAKTTREKSRLRDRATTELLAFLATEGRIAAPQTQAPEISILIILYNQAPLTLICLRSLAESVDIPAEVIIVDNASSDQTGELLARIDGAHIIRNNYNRHFLHGVNQAAAVARGKAVLLLNNDASLTPGALRLAQQTLYSADDIAAVGGKLILPNGRLQEAGSVIWNDGSCAGYGRGWYPDCPECQFRRDVDYCSGAFLLIRRDVFEQLGRFDPRFAPAYYEEADFCLRLREKGYRVVYDPRAEIHHFEFGSSKSPAQAVALMERNRALFRDRHAPALRSHLPPGSQILFARDISKAARLLFVDDRVPFESLGAGFPRAAKMLERLVAMGLRVTHYPLTMPYVDWNDVRAEHSIEIEFMGGYGRARFGEFLEERAGYYDFIVISRPHNMTSFLAEHAAHPGWYRGVGVIYDAEAVFAVRDARQLQLKGVPLDPAEAKRRVAFEVELARRADAIITVSEAEAGLFRSADMPNVHVLGHALAPEPTPPSFSERRDILMVGAFPSDDSPNADGLWWFAREVMPRLDAAIGVGYRVRIAGELQAPSLRRLNHPRIDFLGRVNDLTPEYARARVFVGPTQFAAGVPHKLHGAAARGVPIIATDLLAAQLGWQPDVELLSAETADAFAAQTARLYTDQDLWSRLRNAALARVAVDCSLAAFDSRLARILGSMDKAALRPGRRSLPC